MSETVKITVTDVPVETLNFLRGLAVANGVTPSNPAVVRWTLAQAARVLIRGDVERIPFNAAGAKGPLTTAAPAVPLER